jgi:hypothetical protein
MTEVFGPCGIGWKFTIDRLWTEPADAGEIFAFALVSVYVRLDGEWGAAIPGIGGHKLIEAETKGLHNNDEAFKMATTDALGVAVKMLGVAADVYLGNWDGTKYRESPAEHKPGEASFGPPPQQPAAQPGASRGTPAWSAMSVQQRVEMTKARLAQIVGKCAKPLDAIVALRTARAAVKPADFEPFMGEVTALFSATVRASAGAATAEARKLSGLQGIGLLKQIMTTIKPGDMNPEDQAAVVDVVLAAEKDMQGG